MGKIKKLSDDLVAKIAAGEVIERPASVVKELVENSLDAQAEVIKIEIEDGGLKKIIVTDDGCGMDREDVANCSVSHTTSKIISVEDLANITSLGFRGEALGSIAAISRLTIKSKIREARVGTVVFSLGGYVDDIAPIGMPNGTSIIVEKLFSTVPARKKFIKQPTVEFRNIVQLLTQIALSYPAVGFVLYHNGKEIFTVPKEQSLKDRVTSMLGESISKGSIPIRYESDQGSINGFIGKPQLAGSSRNNQYLVINSRPVRNKHIAQIIKEAYGTLIDPRMYPFFILDIAIPTDTVDVNVHPRKEEVSVSNKGELFRIVQEVISGVLKERDLTYRYKEDIEAGDLIVEDRGASSYTTNILKELSSAWHVKEKELQAEGDIAQIHNLYLITATKRGMLMIDQHAAHERILYEQFSEVFKNKVDKTAVHQLSRSVILDLPVIEVAMLEHNIEAFKKLGFEIEPFGQNTIKVNAVPSIFKDRNIANLISEVLDDLSKGTGSTSLDVVTQRTIAYLSCRSAIKAGDALTLSDRKELFDKLMRTTTQYTCPHGRPVMVEISFNELHKMFKRA